jgi:hypothetical protein
MKKTVNYIFWVFFFLLILGLIPICLLLNQVFLAKSLGILAVVSLSFALWIWKRQLTNEYGSNNRIKVNLNDVFWLNQHIPFYTRLSKADKIVFENRLGLFLGSMNFRIMLEKYESKEALLFIGSSAVQAFWGFPPISLLSIDGVGITLKEQDLMVESIEDSHRHNIVFSLPVVKAFVGNGRCVELWKPIFCMEKDFMLNQGQRLEESEFHYQVFQAWDN